MNGLQRYTHDEMQGAEELAQVSPELVRAALARVNASSGFTASERMRRFISFAVEKTLEGDAETLKEYRIGVEVFDRGEGFDPRTDTIVRVEARRLRKKLEAYYEGEGRTDPLVIALAAGSYVPVFVAKPTPVGPRRRGTPYLVVVSALVLAVSASIGWMALAKRQPPLPPTSTGSIAVLPFVDLSAAKDHEYLCDGISEELINALSSNPMLKVAARTSAFRFKGKSDDIRRVGAELAVEHIVEGSVRVSGTRVRVSAQLIRVRDGYHVWSRQFDRESAELFALQEEVARAIAASAGTELGTGASFIRTQKPEAYLTYLEGRHYWRQFQPGAATRAISHFERAIAIDPTFAAAHVGLAESYLQMNIFGVTASGELTAKARAAALRALELDPGSAQAEVQIASAYAFFEWDWKGCEQHFRRAIESQPNYVDARWLFATTCLGPQGRLDDALTEARRATELDPLSPVTHTMLGAVHWYRREFFKALEEYDLALRLDPSYSQASMFKTFAYLSQGRLDLAAASPEQGPYRAYIQAKLGNLGIAKTQLEQMLATGRGHPIAIAATYAGLSLPDKSLEWIEKAVEAKVPQMIWVHFQGAFEPLHSEPRYLAIRARMGLNR